MNRRLTLVLALCIALSTMSGAGFAAKRPIIDFRIPAPEGMCQLNPQDDGIVGEVYEDNRLKMAQTGNLLIALFFPCEILALENLADQPDITPRWISVYSHNMTNGELVKSPLAPDQSRLSMENAFRAMNVEGSYVNAALEDLIPKMETGVTFETGPLTEIVRSKDPEILYVKMFTRAQADEHLVETRSVVAFTQVGGYDVSITSTITKGSNGDYTRLLNESRVMAKALRAESTFTSE